MNTLYKILSGLILIVLVPTSIQAQVSQSIVSNDGFILNATIWKQNSRSPLILLLHQCDADQTMYSDLAAILYQKGFHVLTFDYRGIGKSINKEFNLAAASNRSEEWNKILKYNIRDLDAVMSFIRNSFGPELNSISLLGASCGGPKVLYLAEKYSSKVKAIGILSSRMSPSNQERIKGLANIPALFIAAKQDMRAFETAQKGIKFSDSEHSKIILYEGNYHGYPLFQIDPTLEKIIAEWYSKVAGK